jgi:hypothetical protein
VSRGSRGSRVGAEPAHASQRSLQQLRADTRRRPRAADVLGQRALIEVVAIVGFCVLVWVWRRPEQVVRPYVWVEESVILRNFLADGWAAALEPVQGYLILPATVLVTLAAEISFVQLPGLMYVFALAVFLATVLLLVVPESRWGDRTTRGAMAASASLVPTNPEVFGVLLYSFWWTTLWPLIILGWTRSLWALRAPLLAVGALSSPAGGALFMLFGIAYLRGRRARDAIGAAILFSGFVVQVVLTLTSSRADSLTSNATPRNVVEQSLRVGGFFETNWLAVDRPDRGFLPFAGLLLLAFLLLTGLYLSVVARRDEALLMSLAALGFTLLSAVPAPLISDPVSAGQRYFFLPFIAFGWTLLLLLRYSPVRPLRLAAAILLCLSLLNLATTFSRSPEDTAVRLSWEEELRKCARSSASVVPVPVYFDGSTALFWSLDLTPAQCRELSS